MFGSIIVIGLICMLGSTLSTWERKRSKRKFILSDRQKNVAFNSRNYNIGPLDLSLNEIIYGIKDVDIRKREIWKLIRLEVWKRDNYVCQNCKKPINDYYLIRTHHIIPVSEGGNNELSNLITLCDDCHSEIHPWLKGGLL